MEYKTHLKNKLSLIPLSYILQTYVTNTHNCTTTRKRYFYSTLLWAARL